MNTEINTLAALINLALQKKPAVPVTETEISAAIDAVDDALCVLPLHTGKTSFTVSQLLDAARILSYLIYCLVHDTTLCFNGNRKQLAARTCSLYMKIYDCLRVYGNVCCFAPRFISSRQLIKLLSAILQLPGNNGSSSCALYQMVQREICTLQTIKTLCYHRWLWWLQFSAALPASTLSDTECLKTLLIQCCKKYCKRLPA